MDNDPHLSKIRHGVSSEEFSDLVVKVNNCYKNKPENGRVLSGERNMVPPQERERFIK